MAARASNEARVGVPEPWSGLLPVIANHKFANLIDMRPTLLTDETAPRNTEIERSNASQEQSGITSNHALEDKHLAVEHHLKQVTAYVREMPAAPGDCAKKGSAARMVRMRARKSAQGLVQAYVPADILAIADNDGDDWEPTRAAITIGRRALALRGWRAKLLALLLPRS